MKSLKLVLLAFAFVFVLGSCENFDVSPDKSKITVKQEEEGDEPMKPGPM